METNAPWAMFYFSYSDKVEMLNFKKFKSYEIF